MARVREEQGVLQKAFEAGMRYAYLQFDGIGNDANSHGRSAICSM